MLKNSSARLGGSFSAPQTRPRIVRKSSGSHFLRQKRRNVAVER